MSDPRCVRFELEMEDGTVMRLTGEAAERHVQNLNSACAMAGIHGWVPENPPVFETTMIETKKG